MEKEWKLEALSEFRFEVEFPAKTSASNNNTVPTSDNENQVVTVTLIQGTAEIFGQELAVGEEIVFGNHSQSVIFTWHGATLLVKGTTFVEYVSRDTCMSQVYSLHLALSQGRILSQSNKSEPARTIIIGAGRNSLTKILVNYSVRMGRPSLLVNLDPSNSILGMPGCIGCQVVEKIIREDEGGMVLSGSEGNYNVNAVPISTNPLSFWIGSQSIGSGSSSSNNSSMSSASFIPFNFSLYLRMVQRLFDRINSLLSSPELKDSPYSLGNLSIFVIFPSPWDDKLGPSLLQTCIKSLNINTVVVIGNERLTIELGRKVDSSDVAVVPMPKSGGVVKKTVLQRKEDMNRKLQMYFYGTHGEFYPCSQTLSFTDVCVRRLGEGIMAPSSALPIGAKRKVNACQLFPVEMTRSSLNHRILAITHAKLDSAKSELLDIEADVLQEVFPDDLNIAGFVWVTEVDEAKGRLTILSPSANPIVKRNILLLGEFTWKD